MKTLANLLPRMMMSFLTLTSYFKSADPSKVDCSPTADKSPNPNIRCLESKLSQPKQQTAQAHQIAYLMYLPRHLQQVLHYQSSLEGVDRHLALYQYPPFREIHRQVGLKKMDLILRSRLTF
jgi:hypothetical protein